MKLYYMLNTKHLINSWTWSSNLKISEHILTLTWSRRILMWLFGHIQDVYLCINPYPTQRKNAYRTRQRKTRESEEIIFMALEWQIKCVLVGLFIFFICKCIKLWRLVRPRRVRSWQFSLSFWFLLFFRVILFDIAWSFYQC